MGLHTAYAVRYGSTVISGLQTLNQQLNPTVEAESNAGTPYPQFVVITGQRPRVMFSTRQVAALLGVTGLNGAAIDGTNTLISFLANIAATGLPAAGSVHRTYTANRGLLFPSRLQCSARGNCQVDAEALLYSADGSTHPCAIADNVALPTLTQNNVQHGLGPISLGITGTVITADCIQDLSIDFGNGAETLFCGADLYDTHLLIPRVAPVITLRGINAALFAASGGVPPIGLEIAHAATSIFLRKRNTNGIGFVANGTAEHIKLTAKGVAVVTEHTGQGTARAEVTVQITCGWDGTNAPITINTASAIS